ncbi:MAG: hypothetical protein PHH28_16430 [Desulfuromonadaceae bacterium]|nr:hypothetical protein [Desulfuromonadaceae bacterium]
MANTVNNHAPRIQEITGFGGSRIIGQIGGAAQGILMVILAACSVGKAVELPGITVMRQQFTSVPLLNNCCAIVVVIHIATVAAQLPDAVAIGVVDIPPQDSCAFAGADQLISAVVGVCRRIGRIG